MFEIFQKYVAKQVILTDSELHLIRSLSVEKKIPKQEFVLREGAIADKAIFITLGLLRLYRADEKGNEHILKFAMENSWISDRESYLTNQPSNSSIEAIEDSGVLFWEKKDFRFLLAAIPSFKQLMKSLVEKNQVDHQNRVYAAISSTAEEKYFQFITKHPDIFNRVPLYMVASYLGVSRETLSRIRRHSVHR